MVLRIVIFKLLERRRGGHYRKHQHCTGSGFSFCIRLHLYEFLH